MALTFPAPAGPITITPNLLIVPLVAVEETGKAVVGSVRCNSPGCPTHTVEVELFADEGHIADLTTHPTLSGLLTGKISQYRGTHRTFGERCGALRTST